MFKKIKTLIVPLLIVTLILAGCGSKTASSSTAVSATSAVSKSSTASSSSKTSTSKTSSASKTDSSDASKSTSSGASDTGSVPADSLTSTVATESTKGEGLNTAPGTEVALSDGAIEGKLTEKSPVPAASPSFWLTADKIELTDERNSANPQEADRVVKVTYTYTNDSMESDLLIGQYSFKLLDSEGKALEIYYFDSSDISTATAVPVAKGASCTAVIGFILTGSSKDVTLVYDDLATSSKTEYYWKTTV